MTVILVQMNNCRKDGMMDDDGALLLVKALHTRLHLNRSRD